MVKKGLEESAVVGYVVVAVSGHPEYYPKFGFVPSLTFDIRSEFAILAEAFSIKELQVGSLNGTRGTVNYHPAFIGTLMVRSLLFCPSLRMPLFFILDRMKGGA
ncbi:MAG: hypothetical protein QF619_13570 [Candidatus Binatia bacterium]|nr:hypothetical protein [Candidatus Binatia bacterium]